LGLFLSHLATPPSVCWTDAHIISSLVIVLLPKDNTLDLENFNYDDEIISDMDNMTKIEELSMSDSD
jgi:hypothetical protein